MTEVVLDAGALVAVDRGRSSFIRDLQRLALRGQVDLVVSSAVVAQVWRDPARQVRLVRLLRSDAVREFALDPAAARGLGARLRTSGTADVADAHVALLTERAEVVSVVTSDRDDLLALGVEPQRIVEV